MFQKRNIVTIIIDCIRFTVSKKDYIMLCKDQSSDSQLLPSDVFSGAQTLAFDPTGGRGSGGNSSIIDSFFLSLYMLLNIKKVIQTQLLFQPKYGAQTCYHLLCITLYGTFKMMQPYRMLVAKRNCRTFIWLPCNNSRPSE